MRPKTPLPTVLIHSYLFRGAVKGVVIQQVQVLPEELTVYLGSYGAIAVGNCCGRSLRKGFE